MKPKKRGPKPGSPSNNPHGRPPVENPKRYALYVRLDDSEMERLRQLEALWNTDRSEAVRRAIAEVCERNGL